MIPVTVEVVNRQQGAEAAVVQLGTKTIGQMAYRVYPEMIDLLEFRFIGPGFRQQKSDPPLDVQQGALTQALLGREARVQRQGQEVAILIGRDEVAAASTWEGAFRSAASRSRAAPEAMAALAKVKGLPVVAQGARLSAQGAELLVAAAGAERDQGDIFVMP